MNRIRLFIAAVPLLLVACTSTGGKDTIATLRNVDIEIREEKIEGGLEKAMISYQKFLEETPDSALTPEAIRRLADLKIEREYGTITADPGSAGQPDTYATAQRTGLHPERRARGRVTGRARAGLI